MPGSAKLFKMDELRRLKLMDSGIRDLLQIEAGAVCENRYRRFLCIEHTGPAELLAG